MNFKELMSRMDELDQPPHDSDNSPLEECGPVGMMGMPSMPHTPPQQDSVNMNVSLNASGAGGIRDLMGILKNIEDQGSEEMPMGVDIIVPDQHDGEEPLIDEPHAHHDEMPMDEFANEPDEMYADVDAVTNPPSNDLNKPKHMYQHSYRGGDNPMAMESLIEQLAARYQTIKEEKEETTWTDKSGKKHPATKVKGKNYTGKEADTGSDWKKSGSSTRKHPSVTDKDDDN